MYHDGLGVAEDKCAAFHWGSKSAEQGNSEAQVCIGEMYYYGYGNAVEHNPEIAREWYLKAAEQGNDHAQSMIEKINKN